MTLSGRMRPRLASHAKTTVPTAPMPCAQSLGHTSATICPAADIMAPPEITIIKKAHALAHAPIHTGLSAYRPHQQPQPVRMQAIDKTTMPATARKISHQPCCPYRVKNHTVSRPEANPAPMTAPAHIMAPDAHSRLFTPIIPFPCLRKHHMLKKEHPCGKSGFHLICFPVSSNAGNTRPALASACFCAIINGYIFIMIWEASLWRNPIPK